MIDVNIEVVNDFDCQLINTIKILERENLGKEASINQWVIPVIIRYGKLVIAQKIDDSRIVGVCELIKCWENEKIVFIHSFYVDRKFRSKGIGSKLLDGVIKLLKKEDLESIELTVDPENKIAIRLYKNFGFRIVGLRKDEYGMGIDRYLMRLEL